MAVLEDEVHTPDYWTCEQSEWANDVLFRSREDLAAWYPRWIRHALQTLQCQDVLRFLGKARPPQGPDEVKIDLAPRVEGARVKFWAGVNSLKFYDKEGQSLRPEHTINQPGKYKAFRTTENDPNGEPTWRPLRKGVADMAWRAEIGQAVNNRLLESLATVTERQTLGALLKPLGEPVLQPGKRRARALNPLTGQDGALIRLLAQGKYLVEGFRNADPASRLIWADRGPRGTAAPVGQDDTAAGVAPGTRSDHSRAQVAPLPAQRHGPPHCHRPERST